jgi:putative transposase
MPYRKTVFSPGEVYHLANHGVGDQMIFKNNRDYSTFIERINFYRFLPEIRFSRFLKLSPKDKARFFDKCDKTKEPLVKILIFELLPNHFHLVVEEVQEKGIQIFMRNLQNSYARHFNVKNKRKGPLFQSVFIAIHIVDDEQLMYVSGYIHVNAYAAFLIKKSELWTYPWSSLPDYIGSASGYSFLSKERVLSLFGNDKEKYRNYIDRQAEFHKEKTIIKNTKENF